MKLLHKDINLEVKELSDSGTINGYGAVFGGAPDLGGDVILPGAFSESLAEHRRKGTAPLMFFGHRMSELTIGNWTDVVEDGKGLRVTGELDMEDPFAAKIHRKLKRKELKGLSIGYQTKAAKPDPKRPTVRLLEKLDLLEVSIVSMPMNQRAAVDAVKHILSDGQLPSLPEFENLLREAGFSKSLATAIAGKGLAPLLRGEPDRNPAAAFWAAFNNSPSTKD